MLVRGGVEYDLRVIFREYVAYFTRVADTRYQRKQVKVFVLAFEFLFDIVGVVLVNVENNELLRDVGRYMTE